MGELFRILTYTFIDSKELEGNISCTTADLVWFSFALVKTQKHKKNFSEYCLLMKTRDSFV